MYNVVLYNRLTICLVQNHFHVKWIPYLTCIFYLQCFDIHNAKQNGLSLTLGQYYLARPYSLSHRQAASLFSSIRALGIHPTFQVKLQWLASVNWVSTQWADFLFGVNAYVTPKLGTSHTGTLWTLGMRIAVYRCRTLYYISIGRTRKSRHNLVCSF